MNRFLQALVAAVLVSTLLAVAGCKDSEVTSSADGPAGGGASGSGGGSGASGGGAATACRVGIIDIDKVAMDLGWTRDLESKLQAVRTRMKAEFDATMSNYKGQIDAKIREFSRTGEVKDLPREQQDLINRMNAEAAQQLGMLNGSMQQQFNQYSFDWKKQYNDVLQPIIQEVARRKRIDMVMIKAYPVVWSSSVLDISDDVFTAARAKPPALREIPMPQMANPVAAATAGPSLPPMTSSDLTAAPSVPLAHTTQPSGASTRPGAAATLPSSDGGPLLTPPKRATTRPAAATKSSATAPVTREP